MTVTVELLANFDTHPGLNIDDLFDLGSVTVVATDVSGDQVDWHGGGVCVGRFAVRAPEPGRQLQARFWKMACQVQPAILATAIAKAAKPIPTTKLPVWLDR